MVMAIARFAWRWLFPVIGSLVVVLLFVVTIADYWPGSGKSRTEPVLTEVGLTRPMDEIFADYLFLGDRIVHEGLSELKVDTVRTDEGWKLTFSRIGLPDDVIASERNTVWLVYAGRAESGGRLWRIVEKKTEYQCRQGLSLRSWRTHCSGYFG